MKSFAYTLICLFAFSILGFGQTTTVTLEPTDDVYWQVGGIFRNIEQLQLKQHKQRIFLKFDLSAINGDIKKAQLKLTSKERTFTSLLYVNRSGSTWNENTISTRPGSAGALGTIEAPLGGFQPEVSYFADLDVSLLSGEQVSMEVIRGSGRTQSGWSSVNVFYSKEVDDETVRPQLILEIDGTVDDGGDDDDNPTDDGDDDDNNDDGGDNGGDDGSGDDDGGNDDDDDGNNNTGESVWDIKEDGTVYYNGGNVGIGTDTPITKFVVDGEIRATKVRVRGDVNLPDYVFEEDYDLRSLEEVETYIEQNGHLPEVPSATQVEKEGLSLGDMDATLLKKVEELTLYLIEMKKQNEELKKEMEALKKQLNP